MMRRHRGPFGAESCHIFLEGVVFSGLTRCSLYMPCLLVQILLLLNTPALTTDLNTSTQRSSNIPADQIDTWPNTDAQNAPRMCQMSILPKSVCDSCPSESYPPPKQCLHVLESDFHINCICDNPSARMRLELLNAFSLRYCSNYSLGLLLNETARISVESDPQQCRRILSDLQALDGQAYQLSCEFDNVLYHYDCSLDYSVHFNCHDCRVAYKDWVCSMILPVYLEGHHTRPCRTFCQRVTQECPYFLPADKPVGEQYAGEPTFFCIDPHIPELPSMLDSSSYGSSECCYPPCLVNAQAPQDGSDTHKGCQSPSCLYRFLEGNNASLVVESETNWWRESTESEDRVDCDPSDDNCWHNETSIVSEAGLSHTTPVAGWLLASLLLLNLYCYFETAVR